MSHITDHFTYNQSAQGHIGIFDRDMNVVATITAQVPQSRRIDLARQFAAAPDLLALLRRFYEQTYGKTDLIPPIDFEQARNTIARAEGC